MSSGSDPPLELLGVLEALTRKPSPTLALGCMFACSNPTYELSKYNVESLEILSTKFLPLAMSKVNSIVVAT